MTALKANWKELSRYRQVLLVIMAAEILWFLVANIIAAVRPGLEYQDGFLYARREGETQIYEGKLDGEKAQFTVSPTGEVAYQWGDYSYGPYQVTRDPSAAPAQQENAVGIEISQGDVLLFRGGYVPNSYVGLYQESGEPVMSLDIYMVTSGGTILNGSGGEISQQEYHAPSPAVLARVVLAPELTHRGSVLLYLVVTLFAALNIFQICFPGFFFRLSLMGLVRNREDAEPSDFYIWMEHIEWAVLAIACLVFYNMCLNSVWT